MPHPLELDSPVVRGMVGDVLDALLPWIEAMPHSPMSALDGSAAAAASMRAGWPETGTPWPELLAAVEAVRPVSLDTTSPGYLAYIPGGGLPHAAVADLYADLTNRFTGLWYPAPGFVALEIEVIRWFCSMVGYGDDAGGLLTTGGSLANLAALVAARQKQLGTAFLDGVIYVTSQTHHSVRKAAYVAGFSDANLHLIPVDDQHRLVPDALTEAILADLAIGRRPFLVVAAAGSTAVGAVDPLDGLADVAARFGLWFHVDAAYGGFFALTDRGRAAFAGLDRADSIALDPHKGLFLPYGTGCVLVRRLGDLRDAHAVGSAYLPPPPDDPGAWDFADLGPELSRDFRGLRVWLPLRLHGFETFRAALDEKLDLTRVAAEAVRALPEVRLVSQPVLSLFAFRSEPPGLAPADADALNRRLLAAVNARRHVFLTGATVFDPALCRDVYALRICVLSFRTHADRIEHLVEDLRAAHAEVHG